MPFSHAIPVRVFPKAVNTDGTPLRLPDYYGKNVFDLNIMKKRMTQQDIDAIKRITQLGGQIDAALAERLASAVRDWATERGATHFCHWFQPQTGATAEKHDGFISVDSNGKPVERFSGKELLQSEPDASSFPSGGLRSTFEARGYAGWDPSSPMFLMESDNGVTLYIPSIFVSHHGEALDFKLPLLRSMQNLSQQATKTLQILGEKGITYVETNTGAEQEFFIIERSLAAKRLDIILTGRTIFGKKSIKGQELEDHYFGNMPPRVQAFMEEVEIELYKVGVPLKTRHNEVAPRQFEFAPIYETANIASDHNHLLMKVLRSIAAKHGFMVLLHEKPFAGVNGSGKHVNWSLQDSSGRNLLDPGTTPHQNIVFLTFLVGVLQGIYDHADVLRASVASAGNDHRLGANEAPPAIMSVFLGDNLNKILTDLENGHSSNTSAEKTLLDLGISHLKSVLRDNTDRNRTSPFAFTGNKFEFRAVGSSAPIAYPTAILNAAIWSGLEKINSAMLAKAKNGVVTPEQALAVLVDFIKINKPIRFEGNGYSAEWKQEAEHRGLGNYATTPDALETLANKNKTKFLIDAGVLKQNDIESRLVVQLERYIKQRLIELHTSVEMVQTRILPASLQYLHSLVTLSRDANAASIPSPALKLANEFGNICNRTEAALSNLKLQLEKNTTHSSAHDASEFIKQAQDISTRLLPNLEDLRQAVDTLEGYMPKDLWPIPSYSDLLFSVEG